MVGAIVLAAQIATDLGVATLVSCGIKKLTTPFALNTIQKIGIGVAEAVAVGMVAEKTNVYIESTAKTFQDYMKDREERNSWTTGGRTDYA